MSENLPPVSSQKDSEKPLSRREKEQQLRRQYILDAAKEIFACEGYENASMNQIAQKAEFTKRTVYQYFEDKADLYLSVLLQIYQTMCDKLLGLEEKISSLEKTKMTGMEILTLVLEKQYEYFQNHGDTFKIMYDIGKVRKISDNPKIAQFLETDKGVTEAMAKLIEIGQKDGSVSAERSPLETAEYIKFLTTALFDKLSVTGSYYSEYIGKTEEEFSRGLLDMVLKILRPEQK